MTRSRTTFNKPPNQRLFYNAKSASAGWLSHVGWVPKGGGPRNQACSHFALAYLVSGSGTYSDANGHTETLTEGACIFSFPGLPRSYGPGDGQHWSEVFAGFSGPIFDVWKEAGLLDQERPVHYLEPIDYWAARIYLFKDEFQEYSAARRERGLCRFLQLLTDIFSAAPEESENAWVEDACRLLEADIQEERAITDIAEDIGLPYDAFRRTFQQAVGTAPGRYRAMHRAEAARTLLLDTGLSGREVAEMLGFANEYHFSKRFKQLMGISPSQLRARRQGPRNA